MCSQAVRDQKMSLEEFLNWSSGDDQRYELIDGVVVSMSPPSRAHGIICSNLNGALWLALRDRSCFVQAEAV